MLWCESEQSGGVKSEPPCSLYARCSLRVLCGLRPQLTPHPLCSRPSPPPLCSLRDSAHSQDVINDPDVEAVWICSPSQFHADQIKAKE